ncbi:hypothetical membrane protein (DUF1294 domain) [Campylobacter mucosalis CCUG 21559]|uniref:Hypothetical membrane protein (DUF1294 domain) n=2 Tax=Campylobacter mucosalis TaxID=202 RepID=A0A6G5QHU2_9BACT|nr:hypothetical membrane protein (DUF1294 domain) [Campylobacter mucosalis CCUG 21559]
MCCFGTRVFLLFFITILSFIFHRLYPQIAVVFYYLILANILSFVMLTLFFKRLLPNFVKENSIHYFSLIGGILGSFLAMALFRIKESRFLLIQLILAGIWIIFIAILLLNFKEISLFFTGFLS